MWNAVKLSAQTVVIILSGFATIAGGKPLDKYTLIWAQKVEGQSYDVAIQTDYENRYDTLDEAIEAVEHKGLNHVLFYKPEINAPQFQAIYAAIGSFQGEELVRVQESSFMGDDLNEVKRKVERAINPHERTVRWIIWNNDTGRIDHEWM